MCARYTFTLDKEKIKKRFNVNNLPEDLNPRFNLAPTQKAPVIRADSERTVSMLRWGLIPFWAKDAKFGSKMFNARCETLAEKPSFKTQLKEKRCLVIADGFYEWAEVEGRKARVPIRFVLKDREPFAFAGLWDKWKDPKGGEIETFTIITTDANDLIGPMHDRMPVILSREEEKAWLDPAQKNPVELLPLLNPYPPEEMEFYPVSTLINSPKNEGPECVVEEVRMRV